MCGFLAFCKRGNRKLEINSNIQNSLNQNLKHRGPDDCSEWLNSEQNVYFFHRRLKIIDLEQGKQPMSAGGFTIVFNGEIYNYLELKSRLSSTWAFKTKSDTEVILAAYSTWGEDCVTKFRGMFSFALWDQNQKKIFCARDQFGIKPFYYAQERDGYIFASEIKALRPFLEKRNLNSDALKDYLYFQLYLHGKTLFEGVHELPPAHLMVLQNGKLRIRKYWEILYRPEFGKSDPYFQDRLVGLMDETVRLHLRSDVPVGAYVSGGLDSSLIASLAARESDETLRGFHGRFGEGRGFDESPYAQAVARQAGI